MTAPWWFDSRV